MDATWNRFQVNALKRKETITWALGQNSPTAFSIVSSEANEV